MSRLLLLALATLPLAATHLQSKTQPSSPPQEPQNARTPEPKNPPTSEPTNLRPNPINLSVWRKTDAEGRACASCHSPDGIEIAAYNFSDETIRRRALGHLGEADADNLVNMIHEVRAKYGLTKLLDPQTDRPLQPGGELLPGNTPEDRDLAFAHELEKICPTLTHARILTDDQALRARDELLKIDLRTLKVGIPFNRISEDGFHGKEHATLADWIPDLPQQRSFEAEDKYLADPTVANLDSMATPSPSRSSTPIQYLATLKAKALDHYQHSLRTGQDAPLTVQDVWRIGELARIEQHAGAAMLGMTGDLATKKTAGPSIPEQFKDVRLGWFWLGWTLDPGLQHSDASRFSKRGDYFARSLWQDGPYALHNCFMITTKLVTQAFVPGAWATHASPQHFELLYSLFLNNGFARQYEPTNPEHRRLYRTFAANSFRMSIRLLIADLAKTGKIDHKEPAYQQLKDIELCLAEFDPENQPSDKALIDRATTAIEAAKLYRPQTPLPR